MPEPGPEPGLDRLVVILVIISAIAFVLAVLAVAFTLLKFVVVVAAGVTFGLIVDAFLKGGKR